jgi:putative serine protease PepD
VLCWTTRQNGLVTDSSDDPGGPWTPLDRKSLAEYSGSSGDLTPGGAPLQPALPALDDGAGSPDTGSESQPIQGGAPLHEPNSAWPPPDPDGVHRGPSAGRLAPIYVGGSEAVTRPPVIPRRSTRPSSLPSWLWLAVAAVALAVGGIGGAAGGVLVNRLFEGDSNSVADGSLTQVDTETRPPLAKGNKSIEAVAVKMLPSTVQILAQGGGQGAATGSGFVLDRQGHVVTNNHVVAEAAEGGDIVIVAGDGKRFGASVVGRSRVYDLAVLYAKELRETRPAALGESRKLRVGEPVVAIGSPLGLTSTVTAGIVSALDRPVTTGPDADAQSYINAVQTDAAINPGNSGGPLANLRGQVVGVNSAIATTGGSQSAAGNIGVGFAIPIEQVRVTADQILRKGEARYPVIGATVGAVTGDEGGGAQIDTILSGTPASRAGLREGDVVTNIDGDRVFDGISLIVAIRARRPGDTIALTVRRGESERIISITLDSKAR